MESQCAYPFVPGFFSLRVVFARLLHVVLCGSGLFLSLFSWVPRCEYTTIDPSSWRPALSCFPFGTSTDSASTDMSVHVFRRGCVDSCVGCTSGSRVGSRTAHDSARYSCVFPAVLGLPLMLVPPLCLILASWVNTYSRIPQTDEDVHPRKGLSSYNRCYNICYTTPSTSLKNSSRDFMPAF